jgi:hypothetical protein
VVLLLLLPLLPPDAAGVSTQDWSVAIGKLHFVTAVMTHISLYSVVQHSGNALHTNDWHVRSLQPAGLGGCDCREAAATAAAAAVLLSYASKQLLFVVVVVVLVVFVVVVVVLVVFVFVSSSIRGCSSVHSEELFACWTHSVVHAN